MTDRESCLACGSILTKLLQRLPLDEADRIVLRDLIAAVDGYPRAKVRCANLALDALQEAITDCFAEGAAQGEELYAW